MKKNIEETKADVGEVKIDVAVLGEGFKAFTEYMKEYIKRKDDVDKTQTGDIVNLKENKADKTDIKELSNNIKWGIGVICTVLTIGLTIISFLL